MRADGAHLGSILADDDMAAVGALPDHVAVAGEHKAALNIRQQLAVAVFVLTLELSHFFNGIGMPVLEGYGMTETCGAISGAVAIMGFVMSDGMENPKTKGRTYKLSREIAKRFGEKNTTTVCGTLKGIGSDKGPLRSCPGCIDDAIEIACDVLKQLAE